jgi:hypothetical protein
VVEALSSAGSGTGASRPICDLAGCRWSARCVWANRCAESLYRRWYFRSHSAPGGHEGAKTIVAINKDATLQSLKWPTTASSEICSKSSRRWSKKLRKRSLEPPP